MDYNNNFIFKNHVYEIKNLNKISSRSEMPENGVDDMICLSDLTEGSLLWNLKIRYEKNQIYVSFKHYCCNYISIFKLGLDLHW
jgi:myosin heavy subunit